MKLTLKWNWGTKIVLAYTLFIILILTAVIKAMNQKVDLVTTDYYGQELQYQKKYDKMENSIGLKQPIVVTQTKSYIVISFPAEVKGPYTGTIIFYRADNSKDDVNIKITANADGLMQVPVSKLKKGYYSILIDWEANGTKYFNKHNIYIQ